MSKNNQELLNGVARDKSKFGQMVNDLAFGMEEKGHLYTPEKDTLSSGEGIAGFVNQCIVNSWFLTEKRNNE